MRPKIVEPKPSSSWLGWVTGIFAAIAWVAVAGKFVDILDFLDALVRYWRDIPRDLWGALFSFLRIPYDVTQEQRDTLTVIVACCGIVIHPYIWASDPKPLFKIPLQTQRDSWPGGAIDILKDIAAASIVTLFMFPFVDQAYYEHDFQAWGVAVLAAGILLYAFMAAYIVWTNRKDPRSAVDRFVARLRGPDGRITFRSALARGLKPVVWALSPFLFAVVGARLWFLLGEANYWAEFDAEHVVSLALLIVLLVIVLLAVRKSLRPMFRVLVIGCVLLGIGGSAEQIKQIYEKYFVADAASSEAER